MQHELHNSEDINKKVIGVSSNMNQISVGSIPTQRRNYRFYVRRTCKFHNSSFYQSAQRKCCLSSAYSPSQNLYNDHRT